MTLKILIMGLPGSGKTTLANHLNSVLGDCLWFNADMVRSQFNDWDFSLEGRIRQAKRMKELANQAATKFVICDFVAPLSEMREILNPDFIIWMDTIKEGRFEDTNSIFQEPLIRDFRITSFDRSSEYWAEKIARYIRKFA